MAAWPPKATRKEHAMTSTVTDEHVQETVAKALESFGVEPELITPDATFEALEVDSLDLVELAQIIDERFGVELKTTDVKGIATVADLVALVVERA
jgi:acyl carrier protein